MIKVVLAIAGSTALVCAPAAWADVLYLGGTGQQGAPTAAQMAWLVDGHIVSPGPQEQLVGIDYPADLWPFVGTLSLDRSVARGTSTLDDVIRGPGDEFTIAGVSQAAVVINYEKRRLVAAPPAPGKTIEFVTLGDTLQRQLQPDGQPSAATGSDENA